jgi:hypothetical protein
MALGRAGFLFFFLQPFLSFFFLLMVVGGLSPGSMEIMAVGGAGARVAPPLASSLHLSSVCVASTFNRRFARSVHPGVCVLDVPATLHWRPCLPHRLGRCCLPIQLQDFDIIRSSFDDLFVKWLLF